MRIQKRVRKTAVHTAHSQRPLEDIEPKTLHPGDRFSVVPASEVDAFQGREKPVIIVSLVRSNPGHNVGFLDDWRRMNVTVSRPEDRIIMIGDSETLTNADSLIARHMFGAVFGFVDRNGAHVVY